MPNTKSATRTIGKQERKRVINIRIKRVYRLAIHDFKNSPTEELLKSVYKQLDYAAKKNVITKNKAARLKSRMAKYLRTNLKDISSDEAASESKNTKKAKPAAKKSSAQKKSPKKNNPKGKKQSKSKTTV